MTDRALRKQIIKGCDNAAARAELARLSPQTAAEAVRIYRQFMASMKDLESYNRAHELEWQSGVRPSVLAVQSPSGIGYRSGSREGQGDTDRGRDAHIKGFQAKLNNSYESAGAHKEVTEGRSQNSRVDDSCPRCGGAHNASDCPHRNSKCFGCGGVGHTKRVCPSPSPSPRDGNPGSRRSGRRPNGRNSSRTH